jgi:hypothetical protein
MANLVDEEGKMTLPEKAQDSFGVVDIPGVRPLLEKAGVSRVRYIHYQNREGRWETACTVWNGSDDEWLAVGVSTCSRKDHFCRKTGRFLVLRRAIETMDLKGRRNG